MLEKVARRQRPHLRGGTNAEVPVIAIQTEEQDAQKVNTVPVAGETEIDQEVEPSALTESDLKEFVGELQKSNETLLEGIRKALEAIKPVPVTAPVPTASPTSIPVSTSKDNNDPDNIDKITVGIIAAVYLAMLALLVVQHAVFEKSLFATLFGIAVLAILGTVRGSVIKKITEGSLLNLVHVAGVVGLLVTVSLQKTLGTWWYPTFFAIAAVVLPSAAVIGCVILRAIRK